MFENITQDIEFARTIAPEIPRWKVLLLSRSFHATAVYRFGRWTLTVGVPVLGTAMRLLHSVLYRVVEVGCHHKFPRKAVIGTPVYFSHCEVWINSNAVVGHHCFFFPRSVVTVDYKSRKALAPVIGNHVVVGLGALIVGGVHVGDHAVIGAGSVVVKDVPVGAVVAGNPARFLKWNHNAPAHLLPASEEPATADAPSTVPLAHPAG